MQVKKGTPAAVMGLSWLTGNLDLLSLHHLIWPWRRWAGPEAYSRWCCCGALGCRPPPRRSAGCSVRCDGGAAPGSRIRTQRNKNGYGRKEMGESFGLILSVAELLACNRVVFFITCSSSSEDSSSLSSMTTSLPSSSSSVLVFFFLGFGGSGGSCHIIGCQQREPSRGVGWKSTTKRYRAQSVQVTQKKDMAVTGKKDMQLQLTAWKCNYSPLGGGSGLGTRITIDFSSPASNWPVGSSSSMLQRHSKFFIT